ncbi:MAG TPA: Ig-like domain-containing protein, partial [Pyrinomonadaceae bacterium]|nr:Ig-like domain-containing protein [Pyrinomonadaceae bacterium]
MKTIHPRLHYSSLRVFTSLLVSLVLLVTPLVPLSAASPRGGASLKAGAPAGAALAPATTVVTATKTDSFPDPDGDGKAEPGQTITYDVNVANSGAVDATGVNFSDTIDPNTTLVGGSLRVSPLAFADSYSAALNTPLSVPAPGVLANDTGTPAPTAQPIASGSTTGGGTVTLNADGSFSYTPATGFQGADTFTYTATNGTTPNDSATVTINVDDGPVVLNTSPANGANGVAPNSNITVNFSEPVNVSAASFKIECPAPGNLQGFSFSGSGTSSITLDPTADLPAGTQCTVTVVANQVTDVDSFDPPDQMAADYTFSFGVKPVAVDDMRSATGNVRINTATTGYSVLANDLAPGATITAFDPTSANGGEVVVNTSTGTFSYNPPRGFEGTDSFNYTITNSGGSDTGTVVLTVTDTIWFIDDSAGSCAASDCGRLTSPYNSLAAFEAVNGAAGTGNPEAGDSIFIYAGNYTAPLTLEDNQIVVGQGAAGALTGLGSLTGITAAPDSDPLPSTGGTAPVITSVVTSGAAFRLAQNNHLHGLSFSNTDGAAISGASNIGAFLFSEISIDNSAGGAPGISLTGGGSVTSTGVNTITTGTGTALNVANTDIAATGLTFKSISAGTASAGPASGIVLDTTGSLGGLTVTGSGNNSQGGDDSGGTIQKTTGPGVSLNSTTGPSFTNLKITNTAGDGVRGTRVTNFTFKNGKIDTTGTNTDESNIGFHTDIAGAFANVSGALTITSNALSNARYHGVDIRNFTGTISNADISNNSFVSSTSGANSLGSAVRLIAFGNAGTHADVTKATIDSNNIQNFPSGAGIVVQGGNSNSAAAPAGTMGVAGDATNVVAITNNLIKGQSAANRIGTNAITTSVNGRGQGNFNISNNGTAANPITNVTGNVIANSALGIVNVTSTINNNFVVANHTAGLGGALGISVGASRTFAVTDVETYSVVIKGNNISQTDGNGILA